MPNSILNTRVTTIDGKETSPEAFKGDVLLIVNVASQCGLTPQYEQLENIQQALGGAGLSRARLSLQSVLGEAGQR